MYTHTHTCAYTHTEHRFTCHRGSVGLAPAMYRGRRFFSGCGRHVLSLQPVCLSFSYHMCTYTKPHRGARHSGARMQFHAADGIHRPSFTFLAVSLSEKMEIGAHRGENEEERACETRTVGRSGGERKKGCR